MTLLPVIEAAALLAAAYASVVEPYWVRAVTYHVPIQDWPEGLDGLTIVQLSDLHGRTTLWHRPWACAWLDEADLIVVTGDLYSPTLGRSRLAERLKTLPSDRTRFVTGNHDYRGRRRDIGPWDPPAEVLLDNRWEERVYRGQPWVVAGVPDMGKGAPDWSVPASVPRGRPAVLLSHRPDAVLHPETSAFGLVLAGHTHGGQVALPILGPILLHSRLPRGHTAGLVALAPNRFLVISRGLGTSELPVRFWCRPEVVRIVLHTGSETSQKEDLTHV